MPKLLTLVLWAASLTPPLPAAVQEVPASVAAAERLEREGRWGEAADSLLSYLRLDPNDGGVRWRAAQLLHRAGRTDEALGQYETAGALLPNDPWLRLEHAEVLGSTGAFERAAALIVPLADAPDPVVRGRALTLLGTLAYWGGDLPAAVDHFEAALALDPTSVEAARQLAEIRAATRPWLRLSLQGMEDNQPYRRGHGELEGGLFLTPLWSAAVAVVPRVLDPGAPAGRGPRSHGTTEAAVMLAGFLPAARLDLTLAAGAAIQEDVTWTGEATLARGLGRGLRLRATAERDRYLWTTSSADTLLMVDGLEVALDAAASPRWAGEAVLHVARFPDGNTVRTAYGWLLAPLAPVLRAGASVAWEDAEETRWSPALDGYAPYFTPERQRTVSVLGELALPLGAATLRASGSWGVWARELAPSGVAVGRPGNAPDRTAVIFDERAFTPWSARAALDLPAGDHLTLHAEAERAATAFYRLTRAGLAVVVRPGAAAPR